MRSKIEVENELFEANEKLKSYQMDVANYDERDSAERYLFFTSSNQIIREYSQRVQQLETEIQGLSSYPTPTSNTEKP